MNKAARYAVLALSAAILGACAKPQPGTDQPLAYAPADTPYAWANLEPQPQAMTDWSQRQLQAVMPIVIDLYDGLLKQQKALGERETKILAAVLDELRGRDTFAKLRELGYKPDARVAIYGVGLVPVLRLDLGDAAAFKAMIARVEGKVGEKIPTGKTGAQEYWQFGDKDVQVAVAVQGSQLVATLWPSDANDTVKQLLLGITRPDKNLFDAGTLQAIAKKYNYSPYGEGYLDFAAITQRLSNMPTGADLEIAKALKLPTDVAKDSPACIEEARAIAQKFPRIVAGAETYAPPQLRIAMQLETEPALAQALMAALAPAPGTGASAEGLFDLSLATPLLKLKEFWLTQADAVAAKPFACPEFADLNTAFAKSKAQLGATIPPPFSDLTGVRMTLDKLEPRKDSRVPDVASRMLIATNNPLAAVGMAQMALPQLKDLQITTDGKPVALPASLLPASAQLPPVWLALTDKAIALAAGQGSEATLGAYFAAPPGATPVFLRVHFSGALYGLLGKYADLMQAAMPAEQKARFGTQTRLFGLYEKMIRSGEFIFEANANGIGMRETVDLGE
ncbi:MAG: hypothetical protein JSS42_00040 [Proteobacteria bacterium]|uniref:hypothetical protein n=1 Tax=Rudaea sp. TaxID=2136325 RepID=UPI0032209C87|nr:hypothetical protein [Pseudomonadota bacterium]